MILQGLILHFKLVYGLLLENLYASINLTNFLLDLASGIPVASLTCLRSESSTMGCSATTMKPGKLPCILGRIGTAGSAFSGIMTNSVTFKAGDSVRWALVLGMSCTTITTLDCVISRIHWFAIRLASKCTRLLSPS